MYFNCRPVMLSVLLTDKEQLNINQYFTIPQALEITAMFLGLCLLGSTCSDMPAPTQPLVLF